MQILFQGHKVYFLKTIQLEILKYILKTFYKFLFSVTVNLSMKKNSLLINSIYYQKQAIFNNLTANLNLFINY